MKKVLSAALFVALAVCVAPNAFAQCQLAPPVLHDPGDGALVNFGTITLRWDAVAGAATYKVFISIDNGPLELHADDAATTHTLVIDAGRNIKWKITAEAPGCGSNSSPIFTFNTSCPSDKPDIIGPARGAQFAQGQTIHFAWQAVVGSTGYDVIVTPDFGETFGTLIENTPSRTYSATLPNGDWGWHVRANFDGQCPPAYSEPSNFQVGNECNKPAPALISPAGGATATLPITFQWGAVPGATGYELLAAVGGQLRLIARTTETSAVLDHGIQGTFEWFVQAEFPDGCPDSASEHRSITVEAGDNCGTGVAQPQSPPNGATGLHSPVRFTWTGVAGATGYRVLAAIGASDPVLVGSTTATSLEADVPAGSGYWIVQTLFGDECPSTLSARSTFIVSSGVTCDDIPPVLVSPANNATNVASPVTFDWNPVKNTLRYALLVATGANDFEFYGTTQETQLQAFVPDGSVRWFVIAYSASCPERRSPVFAFTAGSQNTCPTGTIRLQTPPNDATVNSPVTLSWSGLAGVESYRVTILVNGTTPIVRRTTNTQETFELPAGDMKWLVEGLRGECRPVLSPIGEFTIARGANCGTNPVPTLITPVGTQANPAQRTSPVTFSWNAASGALAYRLWVSRNGNAFEDIGVTDQTTITLPLPGGVYAWYLDAVFRGCDPTRSVPAWFVIADTTARCPGQAPTPLSPAQGSNAAAPVTFTWSAVNGADRYRLFASIDGSEERLLGTTEDTSLTRVLPPGVARWRVEAVSDRCAALSSGVIQFNIPQAGNCSDAAAQIVSPSNGATEPDPEVEFVWSPVLGAVRYVVIARTQDGSAVPVGETTETSLTRNLPPGRIEWQVITFFAGCEPTTSARAAFLVFPQQNCPNRGPILLLPSETTREVFSPVTFAWTRVPNATGYQVWVAEGEDDPSIAASTEDNAARVPLPPGTYRWFVEARFGAGCPSTESATGEFTVNAPIPCGTPTQPSAHVVAQAQSGTPYRLRWTPLPNVDVYEVQESTSPGFENAETIVTGDPNVRFVHEVTGAPVQYLYRVRGVSRCNDARGPYSDPVGVFVVAPRTNNASAEVGVEGKVVQTVVLPGSPTPLTFVAKVDKPWLTVTPSSGTIGPNPVTLTVTADPNFLVLGTNTGTVAVEYTSPAAGNVASHAVTTVTTPVSVSLVTPVTPTGKGTPPPDALIFPIVGHATGVNDSLFESDIRIANLTPQTMKYQVTFTPSGTDGTQTGSSTTLEIPPNTTTALDDIVSSLFGTGTTSSALGMLEVRPLTTTASSSSSLFSQVTSAFPALNTAASSRTYNFTPNGTFGQYIPAVPFSQFVGKGTTLSLLQVEQNSAYRANFGFTEAAGSPVDLMVKVFDTKNTLLASIPVSLGATQHTQINGMLAANGISELADGRVEVDVVNGDGKVTAYVSAIDNKTNDPLLVNAVPKATTATNRWVVPGMAYINNGFAFWVSDLRIFNAGTTSTPATVTFYPQGNGTPVTRQITLDAGEVEVLDNVVGNLFQQPNGAGGAIAITTPSNAQLHATARTYNQTSNGTYGQFIPGVTAKQSIGNGDRALQILQLESSSRFRTNIGVTETTGFPARVEIIAIQPDSLATPVITYDLAPGEFRQFSLSDFFEAGAAVYNARVTVKVISGNGRVTAYGSAIDVVTQDPTYVPAQ